MDHKQGQLHQLLANMLDPSRTPSDNTDNDLYIFTTDPDFRAVILGEAPQLAATSTAPTPRPSEVSTDRVDAASSETETDAPVGRLPDVAS